MRKLIFIAPLALALATLVLVQAAPGQGQAQGRPALVDNRSLSGASQPLYDEGELLVRFEPGAPKLAVFLQLALAGGRVVEIEQTSDIYRVEVPAGIDADVVLSAYKDSPFVAEAGKSHIVQAFETPNDTNYAYQWPLKNTTGGMWAEGAWDLSANKGQGVVVAVIDTGAAYENHDGLLVETFPQHFVRAPDLMNTTFVSPNDYVNNDTHANDDNGHGSHVTGTIAQDTNNAYGVAGVARNATIMPLKVLDYSGFGEDADLVEALYNAVDGGADVISMSLGFSGTGAPDGNGVPCTEIVGLNAALDYADAHGVVVVAASGNEGASTVSCPAAYPTVIAVGAARFDGQVTSYSNTGSAVDIVAPGGDPNVDQNGDGFSDGVLQETYCYDWLTLFFLGTYDLYCDVFMSGTSMATPHVSATAALLLGEDPTLTPNEVRSLLESTARDRGAAGWDASYGWGALDAQVALAALGGAPPPTPTSPAPTDTPPPAATATDTQPPAPTSTPTSAPPTATPTATRTPTRTSTPTRTPTRTRTPTNTPMRPDLIETSVSNPPASIGRGQTFGVSDTVLNQGSATAISSTTRYFLSFDQVRNSGDRLLSGNRSVPSLAPGASSSGSRTVRVPSNTLVGLYYLLACADDSRRVTEYSESNNCTASAARVQVN